MADIEVVDAGMYKSLDFDDKGSPVGIKFDSNHIPDDIKVVYLYLRIRGKPGSYWFTIAVDGDAEKEHLSALGASEYITLTKGVDKGMTIPFNIDSVPPGHYSITFSVASTRLASFEFNLVPDNPGRE